MGIFRPFREKISTYAKKAKRKRTYRRNKKRKEYDGRSYTKNIVTFILVNAVIWVYLTYILAFMDKTAIAEQLSIVVVKVIIYTILSYLIKSLVENVFKFNFVTKVPDNPFIHETVTVDSSSSSTTTSDDSESITVDNEVTDDEGCAG